MSKSAAHIGVHIADDAFARLVGRADRVLLFEVAPELVEEEWSEPVRYRFVRSDGGLLTMELARV
jgi:hypothetical protein